MEFMEQSLDKPDLLAQVTQGLKLEEKHLVYLELMIMEQVADWEIGTGTTTYVLFKVLNHILFFQISILLHKKVVWNKNQVGINLVVWLSLCQMEPRKPLEYLKVVPNAIGLASVPLASKSVTSKCVEAAKSLAMLEKKNR